MEEVISEYLNCLGLYHKYYYLLTKVHSFFFLFSTITFSLVLCKVGQSVSRPVKYNYLCNKTNH